MCRPDDAPNPAPVLSYPTGFDEDGIRLETFADSVAEGVALTLAPPPLWRQVTNLLFVSALLLLAGVSLGISVVGTVFAAGDFWAYVKASFYAIMFLIVLMVLLRVLARAPIVLAGRAAGPTYHLTTGPVPASLSDWDWVRVKAVRVADGPRQTNLRRSRFLRIDTESPDDAVAVCHGEPPEKLERVAARLREALGL